MLLGGKPHGKMGVLRHVGEEKSHEKSSLAEALICWFVDFFFSPVRHHMADQGSLKH